MQILKFIKYKLTARHKKGYGIHSPFLYNLIRNVLMLNSNYYALDDIANLRFDMLNCTKEIEVQDFGAGSKVMKYNTRKIKDITKHSAINEKYGEMLFRLIEYFKPNTILELGTSLGLGTSYLAMPNSKAKIFTIEGCKETAKQAAKNFDELNINNILQIIGNIDIELPKLLNNINKLDFVYFDGNHQRQATLNYFNLCLEKVHNDTIFYFDDINWSKEMLSAWEEIKRNEKITLTIDLFFSGIVFFKKELSKENFIIKF